MRLAVPLIAIALTTGAAAEPVRAPQAVPVAPGAMTAAMGPELICRDRIHEVRQERELPTLQRHTETADEPLLIAAVDRRIDGCSYMVMRNDLADVRALPVAPGEPRLRHIPRRSQ